MENRSRHARLICEPEGLRKELTTQEIAAGQKRARLLLNRATLIQSSSEQKRTLQF